MNLINQLFFAVLISSVNSTLLLFVWRLLRGFFMLVNVKLIYDILRWICIMYILPIEYTAVLFHYRAWFLCGFFGILESRIKLYWNVLINNRWLAAA